MAKKKSAAARAATASKFMQVVQVRILHDHDHRIAPAHVLAFQAGTTPWVAPAVAKAVIAAGAAETMTAQTED